MKNSKKYIIAAGAASISLLMLLLLLLGSGGRGSMKVASAGVGCDKAAVVTAALVSRGFTPDQFTFTVDWATTEANSRGSAAFTSQTPRSAQELVAFIGGGSPEGEASLAVVTASGVSREQALQPDGWIAAQLLVKSELPGNTGFRDGTSYDAGTRQSSAGEVLWYFVNTSACQKGEPSPPVIPVRAGCGNPQTELPRPVAPPPTTVVTVPPPTTPTTTTTRPCGELCKGPDTQPAPCVDNVGVRCDGIPGSGGSPGNGGAVEHGDDGYSPSDPPPTTIVKPAPPPTTVVTVPPTTTPPTTYLPPPPG